MKKSILLIFLSIILTIGCSATLSPSGQGVAKAVPGDSIKQDADVKEDLYIFENLLKRQEEPNNEAFRVENIEPEEVPEGIPVVQPQ